MPAKTSKEVTDRERSCQFLLTALLKQGVWLAQMLLDLVQPYLHDGDPEPGFRTCIVGLARHLEAVLHKLVVADEKVYDTNAQLMTLRDRREAVTGDLIGRILRLHDAVTSQYAAPNLVRLGLDKPTARQREPLLRQADRIVGIFRSDELDELLGRGFADQPFDPRAQAEALHAPAKQLRGVLLEVDEMQRTYDEAIVKKNELMEEHDLFFVYTARTFEGLCHIAGESELAERVRRSATRAARTGQAPPDGSLPEEEPSDVPAPAEPSEAPAPDATP